jgi:uncharacterized protein YjbI with pentapeptide repeats
MKILEAQQWAAVEDAVTVLEKFFAAPFGQGGHREAAAPRPAPLPRRQASGRDACAGASGTRPVDFAPVVPQLYQLEDSHRQGYLETAHMQPPVDPMPAAEAAQLRSEMARAVPAGIRMFASIDFTGADLSGLDLREVNFKGAWLECADFRNANLSGADLAGAVLAHARFEGAIAIGTKFCKANLGKALLAGAVFDDSDFSGATLMGCTFAGTQMRRARIFTKCQSAGYDLGRADWQGAQAASQNLYKLDLKGMRFPEADFTSATFVECDLSGVDLHGATLQSATFLTTNLDGADLKMARCAGGVAVQKTHMAGADLSGADLRRSTSVRATCAAPRWFARCSTVPTSARHASMAPTCGWPAPRAR